MNQFACEGRLTSDPSVRMSQTGTSVTTFKVAENVKKNKDGTQQTNFWYVKSFNALAEVIGNNCQKGDQIFLTGNLMQETYETKEGETRTSTIFYANAMTFGRKKGDNAGAQQQSKKKEQDYDEEIPF